MEQKMEIRNLEFEVRAEQNEKHGSFITGRPIVYDARTDMDARLRRESLQPQYHSLLYDKYRRVFYRVALHPYEWPKGKSPMSGDDFGREFSIVILNEKCRHYSTYENEYRKG